MDSIKINTTQNVGISYEAASVGDRILATLLDYAFFLAYVLIYFIVAVGMASSGTSVSNIFSVLFFLPLLFYDLFFEQFYNGQTPGKMIMKIKVVMLDGTQAAFGAYLLRWLLRLVDTKIFSGAVALLTIVISDKNQRLGDMAAGTTVIKIGKKVSLKDTILSQINSNYQIVFPQVSKLTDKDIAIIKDIMNHAVKTRNNQVLETLAQKTKLTMGLSDNTTPPLQFLKTVLLDYSHYSFTD